MKSMCFGVGELYARTVARPPNNRVNLTVRPVIGLAGASPPPVRPAGYARRWLE